ncbi:MAG: hypothetical protein U5L96_21195 [Owenweeksia sp.]|nr:hypothetical protein [Owenweeksia sp.]
MNSHSSSILNVALIVREFLQNEGRTLEISKGKMLNDDELEQLSKRYLKVS